MSSLILIVEDNPRNLKLVRDLLEHLGLPDAGGGDGRGGDRPRPRAPARTSS